MQDCLFTSRTKLKMHLLLSGLLFGHPLGFEFFCEMWKAIFDQCEILHDLKQNLFPVLIILEIRKYNAFSV